jgi:hypothetical protein
MFFCQFEVVYVTCHFVASLVSIWQAQSHWLASQGL